MTCFCGTAETHEAALLLRTQYIRKSCSRDPKKDSLDCFPKASENFGQGKIQQKNSTLCIHHQNWMSPTGLTNGVGMRKGENDETRVQQGWWVLEREDKTEKVQESRKEDS